MSNNLPINKKVMLLNLLCEGSSMRSASRIVGCSMNTVVKLLTDVGQWCDQYQYMTLFNLPCERVEVDEIWSFCYGKKKRLPKEKARLPGFGDVWTWTAVCPDSKVVICWHVGGREMKDAGRFIRNLYPRLAKKVQLTSDGYVAYINAIKGGFLTDVDYAMLTKTYIDDKLIITKDPIMGQPKEEYVSTSMVERQNLSMRMGMRRFTRRTNAHSKKLQNHKLAIALYFMYHNFIRINSGLKMTPAMKLGVVDQQWSWEKILDMAN